MFLLTDVPWEAAPSPSAAKGLPRGVTLIDWYTEIDTYWYDQYTSLV
jgi:hypothetical protein